MASSFVITGTRPPSASGMRTSLTASSKDFGYCTKTVQSTVDETLFHSHHSSTLNAPMTFAAPWEQKGKDSRGTVLEKKPARPLLWAPSTSVNTHSLNNHRNSITNTSINNSSKHREDENDKGGTIHGIPMKRQFRKLKHTPTYVDDSLFGDRLEEASFKAPWDKKKKVKPVLNWYPMPEEGTVSSRRRPATALGLRSSPSSGLVPVWKP